MNGEIILGNYAYSLLTVVAFVDQLAIKNKVH